MRPLQWWAKSSPPGGDRVKVSENLGVTSVAPIAPVDTSLSSIVQILFHISLETRLKVLCCQKNLIYKLGRILELVSKETNFNTPLFPFKIKKAGVPVSIWTWEHVHRPNPHQVLAATLTLSQPGGRGAD